MAEYFVNKNAQTNGQHQVHRDTCSRLPRESNREPLGFHRACRSAVIAARVMGYGDVNGCAWCARECHTR